MDRTRTICNSCHQPVWWKLTSNGKRMPIDPDPVPDGNLILDGENTVLVIGPIDVLADPDTARYVSHFATCPNADEHRKVKR